MTSKPKPWRDRGSVWATGQQQARAQRQSTYTASSVAHPAKMLPAIAAHAIGVFTKPGGTVLDPMCGIGTSLVEAVHAGRNAIGVEIEPQWTAQAAANLHLARRDGHTVATTLLTGDARKLDRLLPTDMHGTVDLVLTSPPYGTRVHGRVRATPGDGVTKFYNTYGDSCGNLARMRLEALLSGLVDIFAACVPLLSMQGRIVVTTRPWREAGVLIDFPGMVTNAAIAAGLVPVERCVALLAAWRQPVLVPRSSFFAIHNARNATHPTCVIVHEDVLVFAAGGDLNHRDSEPILPHDGTGRWSP